MASWDSLPADIHTRVARTVSPRNMRSVGRVSRSGRGAANRVHAERVASAQRFRADPRMSAVLTGRSLKTRVLAAVLTAVEVGWTASLTRLRRAGFAVGPWHGAPMGLAGYEATKTFAMPGGVSVTTQITRMAAHGHELRARRCVRHGPVRRPLHRVLGRSRTRRRDICLRRRQLALVSRRAHRVREGWPRAAGHRLGSTFFTMMCVITVTSS